VLSHCYKSVLQTRATKSPGPHPVTNYTCATGGLSAIAL
jgi:hypothetical protein